jgi:DNA-binding transcriptional LysR family regulator
MKQLDALAIFAAVVEQKSFTAAANKIGLSKAAVSKSVSGLERALGARLLNRSTRHLSLTEAGSMVYEHCTRIVQEADQITRRIANLHAEPRGQIRLSAPMSFGQLHVAAAIARFRRHYPKINLDLQLTDRLVDLAEEGFDLTIRVGPQPDAHIVARHLAYANWVICAAPAYLEKCGAPNTPEELNTHAVLVNRDGPPGGRWQFQHGNQRVSVSVTGSVNINNSEALTRAAIAGGGIAMLPTYAAGPYLTRGELLPVLPDYRPPVEGIYAVYLPNRFLTPKVRALVDYFLEVFGGVPYWDVGI